MHDSNSNPPQGDDMTSSAYLVVDQRVADPQEWAAQFHTADRARAAAGASRTLLLADPDDPGRVLAIVAFASSEQARAWRARSGTAQTMARAGIDPASVVVRVLNELTAPVGARS
jgi:hypothetical protein